MFIINAAYAISEQFREQTERGVSTAVRLMQRLPCALPNCAFHLYTQIGLPVNREALLRRELAAWVRNLDVQGDKREAAKRVLAALHTTTLDLKGLGLTALPPGFDRLPHLAWLDVSHNQLSSLNELRDCRELRLLSADHNQIQDLRFIDSLTKLTTLHLDANQLSLSSFPDMEHFSRLAYLSIAENPHLQDLPRGIDRLSRLTWFH